LIKIEQNGGVSISAKNKQFIIKCRAKGRLTIDEAVMIAEEMGLFENEDMDIVLERDRKQQVRLLLSRVMYDGERVIRSIRAGNDSFYVDLANKANMLELNLLIQNENRKIKRSQNIIRSLKKIKGQIEGQIGLDEIYGYGNAL